MVTVLAVLRAIRNTAIVLLAIAGVIALLIIDQDRGDPPCMPVQTLTPISPVYAPGAGYGDR